MARLYADEGYPRQVSRLLKDLGHDVLTVQEAGQGNKGIPDETVLAFAISQNRAVLTVNRGDFIRLHNQNSDHAGIIVCTETSIAGGLPTEYTKRLLKQKRWQEN
jgi:predicted nuclease of predicted toxin-antitoxin system